ncbi:hypothetical protein G7Y89_g6408 [Cudoniella acicularis]|uniref:Uncharacterized protein n=1 Tax=Cudoniella acicularis TaxID=354080 RepID=A0A8H4W314_9HELO|nr:hypothetical protein G7Y89_g6408 [Cudoniella acicularis]
MRKEKKTRSSGYKAKAAAPQSDVYDLPDDDEDEEDFVSAKTKSKASKNIANRKANANPQRASQRASQPHVKKAAAKNTEEIKKRRSAPAVLEKMPAPRSKITRSVTSAESLGRVSAEAPKAQKVENAEKSAKAQKAQKAPKAPKDETVTEAVKGTPTILKKASAKSKSEMELDQAPQEEDPMVTRVNGDQAGVDPMDLDDIGMSEKPQREQKDITLEKPPESEGKKGKEVLTKNASLDMASKLESMLDFSGADDDVASENAVDEMAIEHGSPQEEHSSRNQIDELADARHEDTLVHSKSHQDPKEGQRTNVADSLTNDALLPKPVAEKIPVEEPIFKKVQIEELVTEKVEIEGHIIEIIQAETHVAKKVWIEEPAIKPQVEEAAASEKAQAEEPATEKVSIEEPVVERVQIEEPAAEKVEIEKRVAKSPERAIINVPEATQTNVEISEVDRTKHSSPAEPANSPKPYVEGSADSRKRKGSFQQSTPPKKRKAREIEVQVDPKPVRRSPRIAARTKATSTETCNDNAAETSLVDEHSIRKPTLIEFSRNGPKNQGSLLNRPPSVQRPPCSHQTHESKWEVVKRAMKSVQATSGDKKRKRDEVKLPVNSPPRKRQSSSPRLQIPAQYIEDAEENIAPVFASSPPEPAELSQPPPLPSIPRLRLPRDQAQQDQQLPRRRESSEVFGPRVRLGSQLKARPMSPDKSEPRYIPHQKTKHGQYEELSTKEVIQPQKVLPDPFVEKARKSSDFTERLRTSATCGNKIARPSPCVAKTSVAREVLEHVEESLPDLSSGSGSSAVSRSIEQSRTPLKELEMADTWNMAIRPHYASMRDVVHRIADEMIIKLSNEEDKMELLIDQYKENGTKVLDKLTQKRVEEKSTMRRILQQKKKNMISAYTEAKKSISKTAEKLKEAPIALFEKEWRSRQNSIRDRISKARKGVE